MSRQILPIPEFRAMERPLASWERCFIGLAIFAAIVIGWLLMLRADKVERRYPELRKALAAGWALRTQNQTHPVRQTGIVGPPVFPVLLMPLAQSPKGVDTGDAVPWPLAVGVCYFFNLVCILLTLHWTASELEGCNSSVKAGSRLWWYHRILPMCILMSPLCASLLSGGSQVLTLFLAAACFRFLGRQQSLGAGIALGGAISLQWPMLMLVWICIVRRDRLMTMGTLAGLFIGMLLLPGLVFGLKQTNILTSEYWLQVMQAWNTLIAGQLPLILVGLVVVAAVMIRWRVPMASLTTESYFIGVLLCGVAGMQAAMGQSTWSLIVPAVVALCVEHLQSVGIQARSTVIMTVTILSGVLISLPLSLSVLAGSLVVSCICLWQMFENNRVRAMMNEQMEAPGGQRAKAA